MARKADQPSRIPVKPWTTEELVLLTFPLRGSESWEVDCIRYREGTGYDITESMPLDHALCVITRERRPGRAWNLARLYLVYGVPHVSHLETAKTFLETSKDRSEALLITTRNYVGDEADRFLTQFGANLKAWQFVILSGTLAAAKLHRHTAARKRNLGEDLGKTPAQRKKEQTKKHP